MFQVFECSDGKIIAASIGADGVLRLYDSVDPKSLRKVGEFEADGVSDFNHGMRRFVEAERCAD